MESINTWLNYYFSILDIVKMKSKDSSTKVGSLIFTKDKSIISTGYNGFPRGVQETEERTERPLKYKFTEHAERNAIYNAGRIGIPLLGTYMCISPLYPCTDCARAIIQSGIKAVWCDVPFESMKKLSWYEDMQIAGRMFDEVGIDILYLERKKNVEVP